MNIEDKELFDKCLKEYQYINTIDRKILHHEMATIAYNIAIEYTKLNKPAVINQVCELNLYFPHCIDHLRKQFCCLNCKNFKQTCL